MPCRQIYFVMFHATHIQNDQMRYANTITFWIFKPNTQNRLFVHWFFFFILRLNEWDRLKFKRNEITWERIEKNKTKNRFRQSTEHDDWAIRKLLCYNYVLFLFCVPFVVLCCVLFANRKILLSAKKKKKKNKDWNAWNENLRSGKNRSKWPSWFFSTRPWITKTTLKTKIIRTLSWLELDMNIIGLRLRSIYI